MLRRLLDSPRTYFVGAGLLLLVALATQLEVRLPARPEGKVDEIRALAGRKDLNVVFVLVDTLRADRVGTYGYARPTTPNIDALAEQGVVFERVLSQSSWTKTSMASLWTATFPLHNGVVRYDDVLPPAAVLPAEVFHDAGFRTAGIWRNGWVAPNFGFDQGFEFYTNPRPGRERARIERGNPSAEGLPGSDEDVATSAFEFLETYGRERFLLYLHLMDLHQYTYDDKAERFGTSYSDVYDQSLNWTDRVIGAVVAKVDEIGAAGRTIVVVAADHGEAFLEHGYEGHARNLYQEVAHVPLVIALPFRLPHGVRVKEQVSNIDIWPTLLDLVGLPPLPNVDGRSLVPEILAAARGESDGQAPRTLFSHLDRRWGKPRKDSDPLVAVSDGTLRLFLPLKAPDHVELYDHATDEAERTNLAGVRVDERERLAQEAREHVAQSKIPWGEAPGQVELDELRLNQLRALGYVVGR
jgi:arylsulfatase A-like enzyme